MPPIILDTTRVDTFDHEYVLKFLENSKFKKTKEKRDARYITDHVVKYDDMEMIHDIIALKNNDVLLDMLLYSSVKYQNTKILEFLIINITFKMDVWETAYIDALKSKQTPALLMLMERCKNNIGPYHYVMGLFVVGRASEMKNVEIYRPHFDSIFDFAISGDIKISHDSVVYTIKEFPDFIETIKKYFDSLSDLKEYLLIMHKDPYFTVPESYIKEQYAKEYLRILSNRADFKNKLMICPLGAIQVVSQN